jgi:hypothetical protein
MDVRNGNYLHRFPEGEDTGLHVTSQGHWCACSPRVQQLPIALADREGYAQVIHHVALATRRAGRPA